MINLKYAEKNDNGIECHLDKEERKLLHTALRHYSAYADKNDKYVDEQIGKTCELLNVFHLPEFDKE